MFEESLSKMLSKLSIAFKQMSLYFELKSYIKNKKTYLKTVTSYDRGIGKTTTLIKLARKYNCPIIVPNMAYARNLRNISRHRFGESVDVIAVSDHNALRGSRYKVLLCEEGINTEIFNNEVMPCAEYVVGFRTY